MDINQTEPQVNSRFSTNINNTNYTNNLTTTNDINYNVCVTNRNEEIAITPAGADGLASLPRPLGSPGVPRRGVLVAPADDPPEILPQGWRGLKIDIFNNADRNSEKKSLKVKLGIIRSDGTTQSLIALMNSQKNQVWRKVEDEDRYTPHWISVRNTQERFESLNIDYRISKCCLPNKGGSTDIVLFLLEDDNDWAVSIIRESQQFTYVIEKDSKITQAQRAGNIVASKFIGKENKRLLTAKDLGI